MEPASENNNRSPAKARLNLPLTGIAATGIVIVWWLVGGKIGFEAVNALFAGFAFAGVIVAIVLQKQELELQRHELIDARVAHQKAARALNQQVEIELFRRALEQERLLREYDLNLKFSHSNQRGEWLELVIDNQGGPVRDVRLYPGPGLSIAKNYQQFASWYPSVKTISFKQDPPPKTSGRHFSFTAIYKNKFEQNRTKSFDVTGSGTKFEIREIETVAGEYPKHLDELGEHVSDEVSGISRGQTPAAQSRDTT